MRKHLKHLKKEKGFTLVELLAVIVILGIIAAIAVPMIGNVIERSENRAAVTEALNIISAAKLADAQENKSSGNVIYYVGDTAPTVEGTTTKSLAGYIDIENDEGKIITVRPILDGGTVTEWQINGHRANGIVGEDASEAELRTYLNENE